LFTISNYTQFESSQSFLDRD